MENTVFINNENMATFVCPKCGKGKAVDVSGYLKADGPVRVKYKFKCEDCGCGTSNCKSCETENCHFRGSNTVFLERRKFFRKNVHIAGTFSLLENGEKKNMTVEDISRTGLRFRLPSDQKLRLNDKVRLEFHLDDKLKTFVRKEASVEKIKDSGVIVKYDSVNPNDDKYDKAIGFYLFG